MEDLFRQILQKAVTKQVSDIYLKVEAQTIAVMYLLPDGQTSFETLPYMQGMALIRFIKFQAHLNLAETRRPQAGHWCYELTSQTLQLRISAVGDFKQTESLVLRIIYPVRMIQTQLIQNAAFMAFGQALQQKNGLFLIGGAMGAGKSTTLACLVQHYLHEQIVLSIEDPVEIEQRHVLQLQVNQLAQMTYASLFKLALRHHPHVIVIGEIRDAQTAQLVVQAALTGHCILTTMHALNLEGMRQRLLNLGINRQDLSYALTGLAFQKRQNQHVNFDVELVR
ncbi:competence protein ComGA [Weissella uvarum]|uniref:ATPase, T2SS/T4P/T4SS family n=1 Tax=Weissella uvarum TaxID=1479233 RepID=UPI00195F6B29|nr:competence protein ComGA [Weissella uvarum]MCM0595844.1 Flp pilus assembly complex ATPase component TadA [Weissella uvarum]